MMSIDLPAPLLDLTLWDQLTPQQGEQLARFVEARLPAAWRFSHMATYEIGTQKRQIAHFHWQPAHAQAPVLFSLIPGAAATLGFDRAHPFTAHENLILSWQEWMVQSQQERIDPAIVKILSRELEIPHDELFSDYLATILHPLRIVTIHPLLVEVEVEEAQKILPPPRYTYRYIGDQKARRQRKMIYRGRHVTIPQHHVVAFLRQQRFRLLTADEWEYACAAGSRELFYWVNESCEEPSEPTSWNEVLNAFGLAIARDAICLETDYDYNWELCADPTIIMGDGGSMVGCGDIAYITLASAYYQKLSEKQVILGVHNPQFRRVFDLVGGR